MISYAHFIIFSFILIKSQISSSEQFHKAFRDDFVVPHLFPKPPTEISPIVYKPGNIIMTSKPYFPYQIKGLPDISWSHQEETYYTIIVLGALQQLTETDTPKDSRHCKTITASPPKESWHQWVKVNVFENCIDSTGTDLKPFSESNMLEPNKTHRVLYAFAVYQQTDKIELNVDDKDNSPSELLKRHFSPVENFEKNFPGNVFLAGNYFHVIESFKLEGAIRDDLLDPRMLKYQKPHVTPRKSDYRYFGLK